MRRRLTHDTGYWERKGTATLGRAEVASGLWSADIIISDQTGAAWRESCSPCPGNRTVAIEVGLHLYGRVKQLGNRRREGECVSKIEPHSLSPVNLSFRTKLNKDCGLTTPNELAAVGAWLLVGERVRARPQKEPL